MWHGSCDIWLRLGYFVTTYLHESVTISRFFINYKGKRMIQNLKKFCQNLEIISKIVKLHDFYENTVSSNVWYSIGIHHSKIKSLKLRINGLKLDFRFWSVVYPKFFSIQSSVTLTTPLTLEQRTLIMKAIFHVQIGNFSLAKNVLFLGNSITRFCSNWCLLGGDLSQLNSARVYCSPKDRPMWKLM